MAGRPGRVRLTSSPGDRGAGRPIALLATHAALAILLAIAALTSTNAPSETSAGVYGLLFLAELVLLGMGAGIVAAFDRSGPLVLVDVLIAGPLVAGLAGGGSLDAGAAVVLASLAIVTAAVAGAFVAAVRVRGRPVERLVVAVALVALTVVFLGTPLAAAAPAFVLAFVAAPELGRAGRAMAAVRSPGMSRPRHAAPDAAAVLARRRGDRDDSA
jgi:hypothetical protein